jgi:hypothetical protein
MLGACFIYKSCWLSGLLFRTMSAQVTDSSYFAPGSILSRAGEYNIVRSFEVYGESSENQWFMEAVHLKEAEFNDNVDLEHCDSVAAYFHETGELVAFSKALCDFVARVAADPATNLGGGGDNKTVLLTDSEIETFSYDEVFTMFWYAANKYCVYYCAGNGRASSLQSLVEASVTRVSSRQSLVEASVTRVSSLQSLVEASADWLVAFLKDLAVRLYVIKRAAWRVKCDAEGRAASLLPSDFKGRGKRLRAESPDAESESSDAESESGGTTRLCVRRAFEVYNGGELHAWFVAHLNITHEAFCTEVDRAHCDLIALWRVDAGDFVLFSPRACDLVARALADPSAGLREEEEALSAAISDDELRGLAYDELMTMHYYAANYYSVYYERDGRVFSVEVPEDVSDEWLGCFFKDVAVRLYAFAYAELHAEAGGLESRLPAAGAADEETEDDPEHLRAELGGAGR